MLVLHCVTKIRGERTMSQGQPSETKRAYPPNVVLIGKKPTLVYAVASLMQINSTGEAVLKARGRAISKAVDVVEILKRRFLGDQFRIKDIKIGTETLPPTAEGLRERNVSTIEITLNKV